MHRVTSFSSVGIIRQLEHLKKNGPFSHCHLTLVLMVKLKRNNPTNLALSSTVLAEESTWKKLVYSVEKHCWQSCLATGQIINVYRYFFSSGTAPSQVGMISSQVLRGRCGRGLRGVGGSIDGMRQSAELKVTAWLHVYSTSFFCSPAFVFTPV